MIKLIFLGVLLVGALTLLSSPAHPQALVIDHTCTDLSAIPDAWVTQAKADLHIVYQHTSHGSQLVTGMNALEGYTPFGSKYDWEDDGSPASALDLDDYGIPGAADDLSQGDYIDGNGVTPWVTSTRNLLDNPANAHVNVVIWSWCSINGHNITRYLDNMEILVSEYPGVTFVFMTGHAEGQGEGGFIHTANEQIRQHCDDYGRLLFDFADIENYDPDGSYYYDLPMWDDLDYNPGRTNNWGQEWCLGNDGTELELLTTGDGVSGYSGCESCAHSDGPGNLARINCVLKGRAAWWMFSRIAGWNGASGPTPTPTRTPTITPTPSVTTTPTNTRTLTPTPTGPTPTPTITPTPGSDTLTFQDGISPDASYDGTTDVILASDANSNANLGGYETLENYYGSSEVRRALLRWDISEIPAGATIENASVELYRHDGYAESDMEIGMYVVTQEWTEGTGNDFWPGGGYIPDGVTWSTYDGNNAWSSAGGDYDTTTDYGNGPNGIVDRVTLPIDTGNGWISMDATEAVRDWVENGRSNYGLLLRPVSGEYTYHYFRSRNDGTAAEHPRLVVTYSYGSGFPARINFQPAAAGRPAGYRSDDGAGYGDRGGYSYGWL